MGEKRYRENSRLLENTSSASYGPINMSFTTNGDNTSNDSGYTELLRGSVPCPTCRGLGFVPKEQEGQLIALIPLRDKRLKPRRTYLYVCLAVFVCLLTAGLLVFFMFPRDVQLKSQSPYLYPSQVYVNTSENFVSFFVTNYFTVINENYFSVLVTDVAMTVLYDTQVINSTRNQSSLSIPLRENREYYVQIQITFNNADELGYMAGSCLSPVRWAHEMVMIFQLTVSYSFLGHTEQTTMSTYQFVSCYGGNESYPTVLPVTG
ncbi:hypothetical protein ACJMK2_024241 [Sinanodonta woodiana]|uniref:Transmembrane protein 106B n=1 Tax=Sinanodonta woodiana TaxID=1069815 RepID=A0ABD3T6S4_SINWO